MALFRKRKRQPSHEPRDLVRDPVRFAHRVKGIRIDPHAAQHVPNLFVAEIVKVNAVFRRRRKRRVLSRAVQITIDINAIAQIPDKDERRTARFRHRQSIAECLLAGANHHRIPTWRTPGGMTPPERPSRTAPALFGIMPLFHLDQNVSLIAQIGVAGRRFPGFVREAVRHFVGVDILLQIRSGRIRSGNAQQGEEIVNVVPASAFHAAGLLLGKDIAVNRIQFQRRVGAPQGGSGHHERQGYQEDSSTSHSMFP